MVLARSMTMKFGPLSLGDYGVGKVNEVWPTILGDYGVGKVNDNEVWPTIIR